MQLKFAALGALLLALGICAVVFVSRRAVAPEDSATRRKPQEISAASLFAAYDTNGVAADKAYKGRLLAVRGRVDSISTDILGTPYVTLETGELLSSVQCMFDGEPDDEIAHLRPGHEVVIVGTCEGQVLLNVLLKDSYIAAR